MTQKSFAVRLVTRFRGNRLLSFLMNACGRQINNHRWVFILGCYNSGTTLLDQILSSHSQFSGLTDEGVMLTDKLPRPEDFGWRRMWSKCENQMIISPSLADDMAKTVKRHWSLFYNLSRPFLVEKSISNVPRVMFFEEYFQPAYFIHIVRNGYAVSEGIRRKADVMMSNPSILRKEYPIEWCAAQWNRSLDLVNQHRPLLQNFLEITYEELTGDPDLTMKKVCNFVGADQFVKSLTSTSFEVHQLNEQIINMNSRSIKSLNKDQISAINKTAGANLKRYGYYMDRP